MKTRVIYPAAIGLALTTGFAASQASVPAESLITPAALLTC
jgi:hypothetical protein